jgi:hypothetical protein
MAENKTDEFARTMSPEEFYAQSKRLDEVSNFWEKWFNEKDVETNYNNSSTIFLYAFEFYVTYKKKLEKNETLKHWGILVTLNSNAKEATFDAMSTGLEYLKAIY